MTAAIALAGCAGTTAAAPSATTSSSTKSSATGLLKKIIDDGTLTVGIAANPPFSSQAADGTFSGITPTLSREYAKSLGVKLKIVPVTTTAMIAALQTGQVEMLAIALSATPERKLVIDFGAPFYEGGNTWVVAKSSKYKTVDSLNDSGVTIAYNASTFQATATTTHMPDAQTRQLSNASYADLIAEVTSGTSTAISVPSLIGGVIPQKYPNLRAVPATAAGVDPTPVSFGLPQNEPALKASFDAFIKAKTADGTIDKLKKQYLTVKAILG
ncbi:MAG TPA: transporter substrate-binding domain-containing protein [Lacisediminihabitans sp.]|uniref:substrate-binding periplasmic protein n=1 Tax=Lacisediminihabitans sp. TaxID=2787631 RepID=UPI002EDB5387